VSTFSAAPGNFVALMRLARRAPRLVGSRPVQALLARQTRRLPVGPSAAERAVGSTSVYGEVRDPDGRAARALLHGPEAYDFSVATALLIADRVLRGDAVPGFRTPSTAFGPDLVLDVRGDRRVDLT